MKKLKSKRLFTLIELIIVITIISILSTIEFLVFIKWLAKSRDTKRIKNLHEINTVINLYLVTANKTDFKKIYTLYQNNLINPIAIDTNNYILEFNLDERLLLSWLNLWDLLIKIPKDPLNNQFYKFAFLYSWNFKESFKTYQIWTTLEYLKDKNLENSYILWNFINYSLNPNLKGLIAWLENYSNWYCYFQSTGKLIPYKLY